MTASVCHNCGHFGWPKRVTKGSFGIEFFLWLLFIIPGIVYSLWRLTSRYWACPKCGASNMLPIDTPRGRALYAELHGDQPSEALPPPETTQAQPRPLPGVLLLIVCAPLLAIILVFVVLGATSSLWRSGHEAEFPPVATAPPEFSPMKLHEPEPELETKAEEEALDWEDLNIAVLQRAEDEERSARRAVPSESVRTRWEERRLLTEEEAMELSRQAEEERAERRREREARLAAEEERRQAAAREAEAGAAQARAAMEAWHRRYQESIAPVRAAILEVNQGMADPEARGLLEACVRLSDAVSGVQQGAPSAPDFRVRVALRSALEAYGRLAQHCEQGRTADMQQAGESAAKALRNLGAALEGYGLAL